MFKKPNTLLAITALSLAVSSTAFAQYQGSTANKKIDIVNIEALEQQVEQSMKQKDQGGAFGYIAGGAEDELNLNKNTRAFDKKYIIPRILKGLEKEDITLSTNFLGINLKTPIIQAPTAAQGLAHVEGELATARAMANVGSIFSLSTYGNNTIEDVARSNNKAPFFLQLYMSDNNKFNEWMVTRARQNGAKAIILTVDSTIGGYRERDVKNNFSFPEGVGFANLELFAKTHGNNGKTGSGSGISEIYAQAKQNFKPSDIGYIKRVSGLPVIVKGVQHPEDADIAIRAGADAIWVSNHGGRQLDTGPASIDVLPSIAKAVNKRVPIVFDSGVRRGSHVFIALASGADIVAVGRPVLYGLQLGGTKGVESVFEQLNKELEINMMLTGNKTINDVKNTKVYTDKDFE